VNNVAGDWSNTHVMDLPGRVVVGKGVISDISKYLDPLLGDGEGVYIVTGPKLRETILDRLVDNLSMDYRVMVVRNSSKAEYESLLNTFNVIHGSLRYPTVIGFGGGKSIDMAKLLAYKYGLTFVSIPTAPSHDGIASQFASLRGANKAFSVKTLPPKLVVVDIGLIMGAPMRLIASGVGDVLAKFTAVADWQLAREEVGEYYGEYSANLALMSAKLVLDNYEGIASRDENSIRTLVEALISTGVAAGIAGSSRPCSGSEHLFSHAIDLLYPQNPAYHGEKVGLGTIMMAYLHGLDWEGIREAIRAVGGPIDHRSANLSREMVIRALVEARKVRPERYTILHKLMPDREAAEKIARETKVL